MAITLELATSKEDWRRARELIEEYAASLDVDLTFQDLAAELAHLSAEYGPPSGALLLARHDDAIVGCVGLRRWADGVGEIKRLYVTPAGRGAGVGRLLATGIVAKARALGYGRVVLDTLPSMTEARALYVSLGFAPIAAYRFNPVPGTSFLALDLAGRMNGL
jgi:GNAT superfamily N-acetyltransferase